MYLLILISLDQLHFKMFINWVGQGTLSEGERELSTIDILVLVLISSLNTENIFFTFYKTGYLDEEVTCTEPSHSVSVPR